jgi:cell division control protein 6
VGKIGTGKTVLAQNFGLSITKMAEQRNINLRYIHVNCRECRGNFYTVLQRVITNFIPNFPKRGYSTDELFQALLESLEEKRIHLILTLDELETLIQKEGSDPLYKLTRLQESRTKNPHRLSLICILREPKILEILDSSTRSTLQNNIIYLEPYKKTQLENILKERVKIAFKPETVPHEVIRQIAKLGELEGGNARYSIEVLWRAGKYADLLELPQVTPECVRKAAVSIYPSIDKREIANLSLHEKLLLLGIVRRINVTQTVTITMGEAENAYLIVCEEFNEKPRGHTQIWKYINNLSMLDIVKTESSGIGQKGQTTLISLPWIPASDLEKELIRSLVLQHEGDTNFNN